MEDIDTRYLVNLVGDDHASALMAKAGLVAGNDAFPPTLHPAIFWRLCTENIQLHNDETHGVAAEPVPRGSVSVLFSAAKEAETLVEALDRLADTARLIRKECQFTVGRSREALHFTVMPAAAGNIRAEIYAECFAVVIHCALRWMTGRRLDPLMVRGASSLRELGDGLLTVLHAPVRRQGTGVTIHYDAGDAQVPILEQRYTAWGDPEFESFRTMIEEDDAQASAGSNPARNAVRRLLSRGLHLEREVAGRLNWSVATLRRRLSGEGASFRQLLSEVRRTQLQDMLATDMPIADISEKLRFSDDRSLRRFCRDSFGVSPQQYRRMLRGE